MSSAWQNHLLYQLAHLYGVQTAYYDVSHHRHQVSTEALLAILQSLGAPIATPQDVPTALRQRQQELWQRPLEPVAVAWDGEPCSVRVRLCSSAADALLKCHLKLETGEQQRWERSGADLPVAETVEIEGVQYVGKQLLVPGRLPWGYHQLILELPGGHEEMLIISAPTKAYLPPVGIENRTWGVFLPLYALHTKDSWGGGDF